MASATLQIIGEASSVTRMFGQVVAASRKATAAIAADWRRLNALQEAGARAGARAAGDAAVRAAGAAKRSASEHERAEKRKTAAARAEAGRRGSIGQRETATARRHASDVLSAFETAEKKRTAVVEREARRRANVERHAQQRAAAESSRRLNRGIGTLGRAAVGAIGGAARFAGGTAADALGQVQDAQQRRALTQRTLGLALYQAGADGREVRGRMAELTAFAAEHGMDSSELASALNASQTEFSSLAAATPAERARRFRGAMETARLGRNTGNDPSEFLRLQGMLSQSGFDPGTQRQALMFAAGAAQRGAVETGALTREAMSSMMARMSQASGALGAGATPEQRQQAALGAFREHFAEIQVARGFGNSTRRAGEATRRLSEALGGSRVQDAMLNNIRVRRDAARDPAERARLQGLEDSLYERDPTRTGDHRRLRAGTGPLQLAAALASAGFDATSMSNMFAGGGHGNAMSLQANWRNMMGVMLSQDAEGVSGADRIRRLMDPNVALTAADEARGTKVFESDPLAEQTKRAERRDTSLTDNTSALVQLNATLQAYRAANPIAAIAANQAGGPLAEMVAAQGGQPGRLGIGDMTAARIAAGREAAGGTLGFYWRALTSDQEGPYDAARDTDPEFRRRYQAALEREVTSRGGLASEAGRDPSAMRELAASFASSIRQALQGANITATIDPVTAAQTRGAQGGQGAPPSS